MSNFQKAIYRLSEIPIKIPKKFLLEAERAICKFIWNKKNPGEQELFSTIKELLGNHHPPAVLQNNSNKKDRESCQEQTSLNKGTNNFKCHIV